MDPIDYAAACRGLTDLSGQTAYIAGAGTSHGQAIARLFAAAGARLFLGHADVAVAEALAAEIDAADGFARAAALDVVSEVSVQAWFEQASLIGAPNILVNAATLVGTIPLTETSTGFWDRMMAVNLRGVFLCLREGIKAMVAGGMGGCILNVTTIGARLPVRVGNAAYSSSKAGAEMLTRNAAFEHARNGIRVNVLAPGPIRTEEVLNPDPESQPGQPASMDRSLMGLGQPLDVAIAALFLAGPGGRFITGQTITMDGGYLIS